MARHTDVSITTIYRVGGHKLYYYYCCHDNFLLLYWIPFWMRPLLGIDTSARGFS